MTPTTPETSTPETVPEAGAALAGLPTAAISDALDKLGLPGSLHGIGPLRPGQRACGPAFTVRYEPVDDQHGTVGDFLDDVPAGGVVVIDNDGRTDCTVWGGIMTQVAALTGVAGTVINGVCRDVATPRAPTTRSGAPAGSCAPARTACGWPPCSSRSRSTTSPSAPATWSARRGRGRRRPARTGPPRSPTVAERIEARRGQDRGGRRAAARPCRGPRRPRLPRAADPHG